MHIVNEKIYKLAAYLLALSGWFKNVIVCVFSFVPRFWCQGHETFPSHFLVFLLWLSAARILMLLDEPAKLISFFHSDQFFSVLCPKWRVAAGISKLRICIDKRTHGWIQRRENFKRSNLTAAYCWFSHDLAWFKNAFYRLFFQILRSHQDINQPAYGFW